MIRVRVIIVRSSTWHSLCILSTLQFAPRAGPSLVPPLLVTVDVIPCLATFVYCLSVLSLYSQMNPVELPQGGKGEHRYARLRS